MARWVSALLVCGFLSGCVSSGRYPEAVHRWQRGRYQQATDIATAEISRFHKANSKAARSAEATLASLDALLELPLVLPDETPHRLLSAPLERAKPEPLPDDSEEALVAKAPRLARSTLGDALADDLASDGALRVIRALQTVERLKLRRYGRQVLALAFRREPWQPDHPRLEAYDAATRSLAVKQAAQRTLEALHQSN